ncbi:glycosyltransferase [Hydrogenophaga sp.]|uniref:glycosyltransferase n=1 Tax=Hydrogenophaga sp. TaxID=1904254 RepID=UPI00286D8BDD|nr:glycosyltransferase [Hydrogenophaga sp.]
MPSQPCHVVHLVYRFTTGGLENVVAQLVNQLPADRFRHTILSLTDIDPTFAQRIDPARAELMALNKPPGQPFALYPRAWRVLRQLRPDVVHSCNLAALEFMPVAALAGVPLRVHAEHGMDTAELNGKGSRYLSLRRFYRHFVHDQVAVSDALGEYLRTRVGVAPAHVHHIPNGVDIHAFHPRQPGDPLPPNYPFVPGRDWVMGTVGRQVDIKNPLLLVDAFIALVRSGEPGTERMRLALVGDGPLGQDIRERLQAAGLLDRAWLPGVRGDVAHILRALDCFVLPSRSEATSCTLQEAMATGLPIVTTDVGGNAALLDHGRCGALVPTDDATALAAQILQQQRQGPDHPQAAAALTKAGQHYGLDTVIQRYRALFLGHADHHD